MTRDLSPFARFTLLISELGGRKLEELTDVKKCGLAHHAAELREEFTGTPHRGAADEVERLAGVLLARIRGGEPSEAEAGDAAEESPGPLSPGWDDTYGTTCVRVKPPAAVDGAARFGYSLGQPGGR